MPPKKLGVMLVSGGGRRLHHADRGCRRWSPAAPDPLAGRFRPVDGWLTTIPRRASQGDGQIKRFLDRPGTTLSRLDQGAAVEHPASDLDERESRAPGLDEVSAIDNPVNKGPGRGSWI